MPDKPLTLGHCQCGNTSFKINKAPVMRVICHCTICQEFNEADYADICIFQSKDVELPEAGKVDYKSYTNPPMVQRGKCVSCHKPTIEYLDNPVSPKLIIVPSENIDDQSLVPEVLFHTFYHRRKKDMDDGIKKYSGLVKGQAMFMWHYFRQKRLN